MSASTSMPAARVAALFAWSRERVDREATAVTQILQRFADAILRASADPLAASTFLQQLDLRAISRDHDWRAQLARARARDDLVQQRTAIVRYAQYLSLKKSLLEYIRDQREGLEATDRLTELAAKSWTERASNGAGVRPMDAERGDYSRILIGETVLICVPDGEQLELMLADHRFRLIGGCPPCFVDQNGVMCVLRDGRNIVGRHPEADVSVDPNFGDVSRAHLLLVRKPQDQFLMMDVSSQGTYVHRNVLRKLSIVTA